MRTKVLSAELAEARLKQKNELVTKTMAAQRVEKEIQAERHEIEVAQDAECTRENMLGYD